MMSSTALAQLTTTIYDGLAGFAEIIGYVVPIIVALIFLRIQHVRDYQNDMKKSAESRIKMVMLPPKPDAEPVVRAASYILSCFNMKEIVDAVTFDLEFAHLDNIDYYVLAKLEEMERIKIGEEIDEILQEESE